jgi:hypothetical protein
MMGDSVTNSMNKTKQVQGDSSMPRWTATVEDARHVAGYANAIGRVMGRGARIVLRDGTRLEGTVFPGNVGNNAGRGPSGWQYYASLVVLTDGKQVEVDYLDVSDVIPLPMAA